MFTFAKRAPTCSLLEAYKRGYRGCEAEFKSLALASLSSGYFAKARMTACDTAGDITAFTSIGAIGVRCRWPIIIS